MKITVTRYSLHPDARAHRYNPYQTVAQNIHIPVGILGHFDLIFLLTDIPDRDHDRCIAEGILGITETKSNPPVKPELLRLYIAAARMVRPKLSHEAQTLLLEYYLRLRSS